ncbi:MAG TPA: hypothetical protein VIZ61_02660 [Solirubrobacterales bacterium]
MAGAGLALLLALALTGCGDDSPPRPPGPLADALSEIGGGGEHGSLGVGWSEPERARQAGVPTRVIARALAPNAESVVERRAALRRRFGVDPLSAQRLVSVGGSYAFGLRLDGVDGTGLREALVRAGGHAKNGDGVELIDVGPYAQVPEPLLDAGVFGLGARDAFGPSSTVLAISATSRAALLGRGDRLIEQPVYRAAADCLGDVVAARMIPDKLLISTEVGVELVGMGIAQGREVLCVLGGTEDREREVAANLRVSLAPSARDPRTGAAIAAEVRAPDVETSSYEGVEVVRATVTPVGGTPRGFFFSTIGRGSLVQMLSGQ